MNFMPATVDGDMVKLPFGDVRLPSEMHGRVKGAGGPPLIAGIRPEHFEDAALVGELRDRGSTARTSTCSSRSAPSCTRTSRCPRRDDRVRELRELAQDAGGGEIPMEGDEGARGPARPGQRRQAWALSRSSGWTPPASSCSTRRTVAT